MLPFQVIQSSPAGATSWDAVNAGAGVIALRCPDAPTATTTLASVANTARATKRRGFIPLLLERFGTPRAYNRGNVREVRRGYEPVTTIVRGEDPPARGGRVLRSGRTSWAIAPTPFHLTRGAAGASSSAHRTTSVPCIPSAEWLRTSQR